MALETRSQLITQQQPANVECDVYAVNCVHEDATAHRWLIDSCYMRHVAFFQMEEMIKTEDAFIRGFDGHSFCSLVVLCCNDFLCFPTVDRCLNYQLSSPCVLPFWPVVLPSSRLLQLLATVLGFAFAIAIAIALILVLVICPDARRCLFPCRSTCPVFWQSGTPGNPMCGQNDSRCQTVPTTSVENVKLIQHVCKIAKRKRHEDHV